MELYLPVYNPVLHDFSTMDGGHDIHSQIFSETVSRKHMRIIRATDNFREVVRQICCCAEDMEYTPGRTDLLISPIPLQPQVARDLIIGFYREMVRELAQPASDLALIRNKGSRGERLGQQQRIPH